jgi:hypothetical protein
MDGQVSYMNSARRADETRTGRCGSWLCGKRQTPRVRLTPPSLPRPSSLDALTIVARHHAASTSITHRTSSPREPVGESERRGMWFWIRKRRKGEKEEKEERVRKRQEREKNERKKRKGNEQEEKKKGKEK